MATVASRAERFSGFSDEAIQFFLELQAEQNRTWFKAHQDDFLRLCRRPLELLMSELHERLVDVYPGVAEVEPHYFRIQRDTRFAKDKAPYKTNVAADLPIRPRREGEDQHTTPGLYLSFGLDGEYVAFQPEVIVCPDARVNASDQPLMADEPWLVIVMLSVRPVFQALTLLVAVQAPPPPVLGLVLGLELGELDCVGELVWVPPMVTLEVPLPPPHASVAMIW